MVELIAVAERDGDGVNVKSETRRIPYLEQWVRDYVDERRVSDGMTVLRAEVDVEDANVESLDINSMCASERAEREANAVDTIALVEF